jgi:hypothetical protein
LASRGGLLSYLQELGRRAFVHTKAGIHRATPGRGAPARTYSNRGVLNVKHIMKSRPGISGAASQAKIAAIIAFALATTGAHAATYYNESFNAAGFVGSQIFPTPNSDPYVPTEYYNAVNFDSWTFGTGSTFVAIGGTPANGAILLNENSPPAFAQTTVSGLTANATYLLSFDVWGDNRPGQDWVLNLSINGSPAFTLNGTDHAPGTYPGALESLLFTASPTGTALLLFTQASPSGSQASPIFDNVRITDATPLPAALPLFASGLGALGFLGWRRKRRASANV